jgi:hypothetical protein
MIPASNAFLFAGITCAKKNKGFCPTCAFRNYMGNLQQTGTSRPFTIRYSLRNRKGKKTGRSGRVTTLFPKRGEIPPSSFSNERI